jgi:quercetin dioxygenase-like cupin family protein
MAISKSEFKQLPFECIKEGVFRSVVYTQNLMVATIDFTNGPWDEPDPYHSHPHEQVSYVAKGEIVFYCEDQAEKHLKAGAVFAVPSEKKHTIKLLTKEVRLVDSFTPIREDFLKS